MTAPVREGRLVPGQALSRASQRTLRDHNLSLVFADIARATTPPSRADVALATGLTKATVSSLVKSLIEVGLVSELPLTTGSGAGRPATPLTLAGGRVAAIGLEINVDFTGLRVIDIAGNTLADLVEPTNLRGQSPLPVLTSLMRRAYDLVAQLVADGVTVVGAALALPGLTDHPRGPLRLAPNLGWRDIDLMSTLADALDAVVLSTGLVSPTVTSPDIGRPESGLPAAPAGPLTRWEPTAPASTDQPQTASADSAYARRATPADQPDPVMALCRWLFVDHLLADNEANLAARVETGRHPGTSFIYVSGEIGIGAAIVVDGQVFTGLHGWAGEIGHVVVDQAGPRCGCGSLGCLETYAGKQAMLRQAGLDEAAGVDGLLQALSDGQPAARQAIDRAATALGVALADCLNLVDVDQVVLGGDLAPLTEALRPGLEAQLADRVLASRWLGGRTQVRAASGEAYPALTGGALVGLDPILAEPGWLIDRAEATG